MLEHLDGRKTYLLTLAATLWEILWSLHGLPAWVTPEIHQVVLAMLVGSAGCAFRHGVQKSAVPAPQKTPEESGA